jgi:guanylate kinase
MIILIGASASGKTEVAKLLGSKYGIQKVVTHTTRHKRDGETDDVDYHFVSFEQFEELKNRGYFVETTFYNGNFYGTSHKEIGDDKVLIVDPNGLDAFQKLHNRRIVTFFMDASETTRLNRMLYRGDALNQAKRRIANDKIDFDPTRINTTDYFIDTERHNIEQIADIVYKTYSDHLINL